MHHAYSAAVGYRFLQSHEQIDRKYAGDGWHISDEMDELRMAHILQHGGAIMEIQI